MGKLAYRCKRPHNKPLWLLRIQCDISVDFINEEYSEEVLPELKQYIDKKILDWFKQEESNGVLSLLC